MLQLLRYETFEGTRTPPPNHRFPKGSIKTKPEPTPPSASLASLTHLIIFLLSTLVLILQVHLLTVTLTLLTPYSLGEYEQE